MRLCNFNGTLSLAVISKRFKIKKSVNLYLTLKIMLSYFLLWFPMVLLAILNGAARDLWYNKYCSELTARQISTFSLVILLGVYVYVIIKKFPPTSTAHALWLGLFWVVLTLAFEFGFGLYRGSTWN